MRNEHCPAGDLERLKKLIAMRVQELIDTDKDLSKSPDRIRALAHRSGVGRGSLQRLLKGESHVQSDTLLKLAWVFNVPVWLLLHPTDEGSRVFEPKGTSSREGGHSATASRRLKSG